MTFAAITPALIVGAMAERMKFSAIAAVHPAVGDVRLFPDRPHGLVLGRSRSDRSLPAKAVADAACRRRQEAGRRGSAGCRARPTPVSPSSGARSTSPAARSCTSTPASPALVVRLIVGKRVGFGKRSDASPLADPDAGRRRAAVGRLVRLQRRLSARGRRHRRSGDDQHLRCHRGGGAGLAARRECRPRASRACSAASPVRSPAWWRSRRLRASRARWAPSCSASWPASCASSPARRSRTRWATTMRSTCSACTASAASSARSAPASWPRPFLGGTGVFDYTAGKIADYDMVAQMITQFKAVCLTAGVVGRRHLDPARHRSRGCRPAAGHRSGARGPRPRRPRRARLQLLRQLSRRGLRSIRPRRSSSTPLPRYVLIDARSASSGRFFVRPDASRRARAQMPQTEQQVLALQRDAALRRRIAGLRNMQEDRAAAARARAAWCCSSARRRRRKLIRAPQRLGARRIGMAHGPIVVAVGGRVAPAVVAADGLTGKPVAGRRMRSAR